LKRERTTLNRRKEIIMQDYKDMLKELNIDETVYIVPKSKIYDGLRFLDPKEAKKRAANVAWLERTIVDKGLEYAVNDLLYRAVRLRASRLAELKQSVKTDLETIDGKSPDEIDFCLERVRDLQAYFELERVSSYHRNLQETDFYYLGLKDGEAGKLKKYLRECASQRREECE